MALGTFGGLNEREQEKDKPVGLMSKEMV